MPLALPGLQGFTLLIRIHDWPLDLLPDSMNATVIAFNPMTDNADSVFEMMLDLSDIEDLRFHQVGGISGVLVAKVSGSRLVQAGVDGMRQAATWLDLDGTPAVLCHADRPPPPPAPLPLSAEFSNPAPDVHGEKVPSRLCVPVSRPLGGAPW